MAIDLSYWTSHVLRAVSVQVCDMSCAVLCHCNVLPIGLLRPIGFIVQAYMTVVFCK